jgi:hypothetical protein
MLMVIFIARVLSSPNKKPLSWSGDGSKPQWPLLKWISKRQLNAPKALKNKKSQGGKCLAFRACIFTRWQRWDGDPMWI